MNLFDLRIRLRSVVESQETLAGRIFDWCTIALIVFSLLTFSIETLPNLSAQWIATLRYLEIGVVALFSIEYLLRVWVAEKRLSFVFSFYGLIDLIAILPTILATGFDLRSLRGFRILRVFRLLKLTRYTTALDRLRSALVRAREELILFSLVTVVLLWLAAVGIYYLSSRRALFLKRN